jgi:predicted transcriptional regulator
MDVMAMTLRLDDELDAALEETARREHRSKQEVVRVAIQEYTSRRTRLRTEALERIVTENADLLRRLGE